MLFADSRWQNFGSSLKLEVFNFIRPNMGPTFFYEPDLCLFFRWSDPDMLLTVRIHEVADPV